MFNKPANKVHIRQSENKNVEKYTYYIYLKWSQTPQQLAVSKQRCSNNIWLNPNTVTLYIFTHKKTINGVSGSVLCSDEDKS